MQRYLERDTDAASGAEVKILTLILMWEVTFMYPLFCSSGNERRNLSVDH